MTKSLVIRLYLSSRGGLIKDNTLRKVKIYNEIYSSLKIRIEEFSKKNNLKCFYAVMKLFDDFNGITYKNNINEIMMYPFYMDGMVSLHLNGKNFYDICCKIEKQNNEKCFPVALIRINRVFQRYIIISEKGCFYLDDGKYLGNDYEKVVYDILLNEIKIKPILCNKVFNTLERHGWSNDKKFDTVSIMDTYRKRGFKVFLTAEKFFEEIPEGEYEFWNKGHTDHVLIGCLDKRRVDNPYEFINMLGEDLLDIAYSQNFNVYISESGKYYVKIKSNELYYITDDIYI